MVCPELVHLKTRIHHSSVPAPIIDLNGGGFIRGGWFCFAGNNYLPIKPGGWGMKVWWQSLCLRSHRGENVYVCMCVSECLCVSMGCVSLCADAYIFAWVCVSLCIYVGMLVYIHCVSPCMSVSVYVAVHVHGMCVCVCRCLFLTGCVCLCVYTCVCACVYTLCVHTHVFECVCGCVRTQVCWRRFIKWRQINLNSTPTPVINTGL